MEAGARKPSVGPLFDGWTVVIHTFGAGAGCARGAENCAVVLRGSRGVETADPGAETLGASVGADVNSEVEKS